MSLFDRILAAADVKRVMVARDDALPGRRAPMPIPAEHRVLHRPLRGAADENGEFAPAGIGDWGPDLRAVVLAGGCFWGFEEIFWQLPGVHTTAVGYAGGYTPNPTYEEVCTAQTGHTESVLVVYDPEVLTFQKILEVFFTSHDPTQEMRQGNDIGTQYRSAVFTFDEAEADQAAAAARRFEPVLAAAGYGPVTSQISLMSEAGDGMFYYAEDYHQQYLFTNPNGYRCHATTGLEFPAAG
ncbi:MULTISPECIES: peptide-methionine (S)-S-oxide reductase MsrA [Gordonia]|uniref:Peptide methionine sulfoxide reductase MsrA n=2 Tax=Gordonia TaxID=2053 RepID=L7LP51_9ACTN|nr:MULTISPECIES: peptide-methionine (S)-S-oxide reductase MsrA [Gordonia]AUH67402.1 peptide-methionine (S)-S-oxide reductase MsrA [Gordonia sp. YC-JH1]KJR06242.1 methionine-S-sulfoxide reductase [Gordonia sihwensis]KXT56150.1 methionine-S-sulfoxide reductase [Gordonia sp. QH-12]MBY4570463.1 peptide-methionine (S)-S-oxide reductase [Gordonia sihwensis]WFN92960.1 peptide-methionine (S)-S-oxide reductase MsrA [Gordonia sihwensis]